ncbi:MAG: hypothetical protein COS57_15095, partial [Syntrophobacterales bacterium CG03_land_8_20_14_0_80_58_14]
MPIRGEVHGRVSSGQRLSAAGRSAAGHREPCCGFERGARAAGPPWGDRFREDLHDGERDRR